MPMDTPVQQIYGGVGALASGFVRQLYHQRLKDGMPAMPAAHTKALRWFNLGTAIAGLGIQWLGRNMRNPEVWETGEGLLYGALSSGGEDLAQVVTQPRSTGTVVQQQLAQVLQVAPAAPTPTGFGAEY